MKLAGIVVAIFLTLCSAAVHAANMPSHIQQELPDARLSGQGSFRWFGLKIYDASLWVSGSGYQPTAAKFILNLNYARELYGERIAQASMDEIRQLGLGTPTQQETWLKQMKELFPDVKAGSQISGVFLPYQGARFYMDGKLLGEISDTEFAQAFFAIWLDPRTSASSLRKQLLAN
jgi:Chalcone isomerase-like